MVWNVQKCNKKMGVRKKLWTPITFLRGISVQNESDSFVQLAETNILVYHIVHFVSVFLLKFFLEKELLFVAVVVVMEKELLLLFIDLWVEERIIVACFVFFN